MDIPRNENTSSSSSVVASSSANPRVVFAVIVAIILSLALIYVVYTIVVRRDSFLLDQIAFPSNTISQEIRQIESERSLEVGELEDIERALRENGKLQMLKEQYEPSSSTFTVGNSNPFRPFDIDRQINVPTSSRPQTGEQSTAPNPQQIEERIPRFNQ